MKYLQVKLGGGLCNKLFCLWQACEYASQYSCVLVEPNFGWTRSIHFSDIYDIDKFNDSFRSSHVQMVPISKFQPRLSDQITNLSAGQLWDMSEQKLGVERHEKRIKRSSYMLKLLSSLHLNEVNEKLVEPYYNQSYNAIHQRTEVDWREYANGKQVPGNENILIYPEELQRRYQTMNIPQIPIFISTGDDTKTLQDVWKSSTLRLFHDDKLEYEVNAAICFEICLYSDNFIGNCRSTFSNLITMKREFILNKSDNYVYNFKGPNFMKRMDKGLQCVVSDLRHVTNLVD